MLDSRLEEKHRKLGKRVKIWLKYKRRVSWIANSVLIVIVIWYIAIVYLALTYGRDFTVQVTPPSMILILVYAFIAMYVNKSLRRKGRVYRPEADDLMLYHACSVLESLEDYHRSERAILKEEHRKNAVKSGNELLSIVEEYWKLGGFGLAKKVFGAVIPNISDNLRNRLIPNLEKGDEETLKKVELVLYQFAQYLYDPSLKMLQHVNKSMSEELGSYETVKMGFVARWSSFLRTHAALRHAMAIVLIFAFSFFPVLFVISYWSISRDTAFLGFASIFSALIVGYFTYISKK